MHTSKTWTVRLTLSLLVGLGLAQAQPTGPGWDAPRPRLTSIRTGQAPTIDGKALEAAWEAAPALELTAQRAVEPLPGSPTSVWVRSLHTDTHVYFLVSWLDATGDDQGHKTWIWNPERSAYEEGPDREDMLALSFEHTGPFNPDMLSGVEAVWDVGQWKAFRTNPQGFAMDRTHRYTRERPVGSAREHTARDGTKIWIARPEDAGDTVEKKQPAPAAYQGDRVPQYLHGMPTGSAADVRARGTHADGRWTVELARALDTGQPDDAVFSLAKTILMAVAPFDRTGSMDRATGAVELRFAGSLTTLDFETAGAGAAPPGFTTALTGQGSPGKWVVREETGAPSGRRVLAQVSTDETDYRFPICVHDGLSVKDGLFTVRFKSISGRVDQAAGLVVRLADKDNYYLVRANPREDNLRLYSVVRGLRKQFAGTELKVTPQAWHELGLDVRGSHFIVSIDGRRLFEADDATFGVAGRVGLWTKSDSVTHFDDLAVASYDR